MPLSPMRVTRFLACEAAVCLNHRYPVSLKISRAPVGRSLKAREIDAKVCACVRGDKVLEPDTEVQSFPRVLGTR